MRSLACIKPLIDSHHLFGVYRIDAVMLGESTEMSEDQDDITKDIFVVFSAGDVGTDGGGAWNGATPS